MAGKLINELAAFEKLKSFPVWRTLLAASSILALVGLSLWPGYETENIIKDAVGKEDGNTILIKNKEEAEIRRFNGSSKTVVSQSYCQLTKCETIYCSSITTDSDPGKVAADFIEHEVKADCEIKSIELIFYDCKFPSNKLKENWLSTDVSIKELTFESCSLIEVEPTAFSLSIYEETRKLSVIDNKIHSLTKGIFQHLPKLEELMIRNNVVKFAEFNLLENVARTLTVLELNGVIGQSEVLRNITGGDVSLKVQLLSVRGNSIRLIDRDLFRGVPEVRSLYVHESQVQTILPDAFEPMASSISQLVLNNNHITTLPEGLFDFAMNPGRQFHMTIENNPWHCNCTLQWLQQLVLYFPQLVTTMPVCKTPKANALKPFNRADFCPGNNSESTSIENENPTEPTTRETETVKTTEETINLSCFVVGAFPAQKSVSLSATDFKIRSRLPGFCASETENGTILVALPELNIGVALIWFDGNDIQRSLKCTKNVRHSYLLNGISPRTTYTICLFDDKVNTPLNCLAVTTSPSYLAKTWLTNGDKTTFFLFSSASFVCLFLLGALVAFVLVRRHPSLLRGSKRVMLVKSRSVDAIVLPKGVRVEEGRPRDKNFSFTGKPQEDGYVTPLPPARLPRNEQAASRMSFQSDGNSYVSGVEPTVMQLASWRLRRLKSELERQKTELPPLPPHPHTVPSLSQAMESREDERSEYSTCTV